MKKFFRRIMDSWHQRTWEKHYDPMVQATAFVKQLATTSSRFIRMRPRGIDEIYASSSLLVMDARCMALEQEVHENPYIDVLKRNSKKIQDYKTMAGRVWMKHFRHLALGK